MADARLESFVQEALRSGASREETEHVLIEAGWSRDQVSSALASYSTVEFLVPVPRPTSQFSARDAFLYLVMFGMLYFSTYNFLNLIFQFINLGFPDPVADQYQRVSYRIRWSTSAVLVTFPIFLFVASRISKEISEDPTQRTTAVRKWLTYLTLALAACIVAGDLVYLLNSMLSGELTMRFVLKSLAVGVTAGAVFWYYLWSMLSDEEALAE